jgi:hypothetical protein
MQLKEQEMDTYLVQKVNRSSGSEKKQDLLQNEILHYSKNPCKMKW